MLTKRGADVNKLDGAGQTALFSAMASPEAVKALLAAGAKANITDNFGRTPLFAYCDPSSIGMVVDAGANVRAVDNDGETALHNAARLGDIGMVRAIAERNADLNRPNNKGQTPLKLAELGFRDDIIAYLKGRGAKD
jgi:ankyrin repeat protein